MNNMSTFQQKAMRVLMILMWITFHKKRFKGTIKLDVTPDAKNSPRLILVMEQN